MEKELLEVAHDYYLENASDLPKNNGDVSTVLLDTLYKNNSKHIKDHKYKAIKLEKTYLSNSYLMLDI